MYLDLSSIYGAEAADICGKRYEANKKTRITSADPLPYAIQVLLFIIKPRQIPNLVDLITAYCCLYSPIYRSYMGIIN